MGVKRAQISKIESGKSISFSTIVRAFKAMGDENGKLGTWFFGQSGSLVNTIFVLPNKQ